MRQIETPTYQSLKDEAYIACGSCGYIMSFKDVESTGIRFNIGSQSRTTTHEGKPAFSVDLDFVGMIALFKISDKYVLTLSDSSKQGKILRICSTKKNAVESFDALMRFVFEDYGLFGEGSSEDYKFLDDPKEFTSVVNELLEAVASYGFENNVNEYVRRQLR